MLFELYLLFIKYLKMFDRYYLPMIMVMSLLTGSVQAFFDPEDIVPMDFYDEDYRVMDCYQCF